MNVQRNRSEPRPPRARPRAQRDLLERIIASAPIGMAVIDAADRLIRVNDALVAMLGRTREELLTLTLSEITHPDDRDSSAASQRSVLAGRGPQPAIRRRHLRGDGESVWARVSLTALGGPDGAGWAMIAQIEDITAEREAADERVRLEAVFSAASDAMVTTTAEGLITGWNAAAERIFGHSGRGAVGQHVSLLAGSPAERDEQRSFYARLLSGAALGPLDVQRQRADGAPIELSLTMSPMTSADGRVVGVLGIARDVTAQRAAQRELALERSRLERAELTGRTGSWEWNVDTGSVAWSPGLYSLYRADPATTDVTVEHGLAHRVHPDDRDRVERSLREAIEQLRPIASRHRVIRLDGRVRTVELHAEPIVDATGRVELLVGVVRDVTEEAQTSDALAGASASLVAYARELQRLAVRPESEAVTAPDLSERQLEILRLISQGLTNREIAERLYLSVPTIKWHVRQILERTGATNRTEAVARVLGSTPAP